jgi:hypothetical protein
MPEPGWDLADIRRHVADTFSAESEERYAAGWMAGITEELRREGGYWCLLAHLAGGWPTWSDRTDRPLDWREWLDWTPLTATEEEAAILYLQRMRPRR